MKTLTGVIDIFDFCWAAGYDVEVWPVASGTIVLFRDLPWWAWIRRKHMDQCIARLRRVVPASWRLCCIECSEVDITLLAKAGNEKAMQEVADWNRFFGPDGRPWHEATWSARRGCKEGE